MKRVIILGGTGTLGQELTTQLLAAGKSHITIFSRSENKQKQMREAYGNHPYLNFVLGDVRDKEALYDILPGADTVFHVAALKHVEVCEENVYECIKTNLLGSMNVADAAIRTAVKNVVFSSTDKAVDPINAYGMAKGLSEKIFLQSNKTQDLTHFTVYRWGNIVGSTGSVIFPFAKSLIESNTVNLTHKEMTRFWISIQSAVNYVLSTYQNSGKDFVLIPPIKSAPVYSVIRTIADILDIKNPKINIIGLRAGEKLHESLLSQHTSQSMDSKTAEQLSDGELFNLIYRVLKKEFPNKVKATLSSEYQ